MLSHGLFSSAGIDEGSRLLLKVFSELLDENHFSVPLRSVIDAGSGAGILGICAAGALTDINDSEALCVRAEDRDELGRVFTEHNARENGFGEESLNAFAEPLLSCGGEWDLILSNVPAKAGLPVLEDFVSRSARHLNRDGRVLMVAVHTLSDFFEEKIKEHASLLRLTKGPGHTVFLFGQKDEQQQTEEALSSFADSGLFGWNSSYLRNSAVYEMEKTSYKLATIHGAESFDRAGGEVQAAAKLAVRLEKEIRSCLQSCLEEDARILLWENDQGHFPVWLIRRFGTGGLFLPAGRNILALNAVRHNIAALGNPGVKSPDVLSAVDIYLDRKKLLREKLPGAGEGFSFIAAFPQTVPQTPGISAFWDGLNSVALPGAIVLLGLPSGEAESFDRKKPKGWTRLGDLRSRTVRRKGFRALAYEKVPASLEYFL